MKPTSDRILILPDEPERFTKSGIQIPDSQLKRPDTGVVVAVGPGLKCPNCGDDMPMASKIGDRVKYAETVATEIIVYGRPHHIMRDCDIYGVL